MGNRRFVVRRDDFKGVYNAAVTYPTGSIVRYAGSSWRSLRQVASITPVEGADWTLFVSRGDQGIQGPPPWNNRGPYAAATAYAVNDAVSYSGSYWRALRTVTGITPVEGADWTRIVAKGDQGNVGPPPWINRGVYAAATAYAVNDAVSYGGSYWRALRASTGITPVEGADWTLITSKGDQGPRGYGVLYGARSPVAGDGIDGEFWINTATNFIFGPKAGGAWPAGTNLVGPIGLTGARGVTPRGAYSAATPYVADDLVRYAGSEWRALRASTGITPVEGADWALFTAKGDPGNAGVVATDTVAGVVELATTAEIQSGAAGVLVATAADLKAELDRRAGLKSLVGGIDNGPQAFGNITVTDVVTTSVDLRGLSSIPLNARGVFVCFYAGSQTTNSQVGIGSADVAIPGGALRLVTSTASPVSIVAAVPLGAVGANAGKISVARVGTVNTTGLYAWVNGWWT